MNRSRGSVRNRADDHQDSWKTAKTVIKMNPSIEVPTSEQSSKPSVNAFTLDEGAMTSFNDMLNHLSVLCWDNQSQSLTIGDPARDLSETGIKSTLVFPSSTSTSARPEGLIELDTSSPHSMDEESLHVTLDRQGYVLRPAPQADATFLNRLDNLEQAALTETKDEDLNICIFHPLDDHQSNYDGALTQIAIEDVGKAWKSVKIHLPEWPERDPHFARWGETKYFAPEAIATRQLAMIATLGIMVISKRHPFPEDATLSQSLMALANAIDVGRYHKRLVLKDYAEHIREIAAGSVPGTAL